MWVESEVSKGSKFFFTITSQISLTSIETTLAKMSTFKGRTILFVDTLVDRTGVVERIQELQLRPFVVHEVSDVADKERCPHIDTIVVDSLSVVSGFSCVCVCVSLSLMVDGIDGVYSGVRASEIYPDCGAWAFRASAEP
jgi:osomolarity two-component system sensor histidine kinase NIK1